MAEQNENEKKTIVLISAEGFRKFVDLCVEDKGFEILHYLSIEDFFRKNAKIREYYQNIPFEIKPDDDIEKYYDIDVEDLDYFWIVEQPSDYIKSIIEPIVKLRWLGYKTPIIVSAFMDVKKMTPKEYNVNGLIDDIHFLRLPFNIATFKMNFDRDKHIQIHTNTRKLEYVVNNSVLLSHDLKYEPYSNVEQTKKGEIRQILLVDNDKSYLDCIEAKLKKKEYNSFDRIDIQIETMLYTSITKPESVANRCNELNSLQCVLLDWQLADSKNPTVEVLTSIKHSEKKPLVYILTKTQEVYEIANKFKDSDVMFDDFLNKDELEKKTKDTLNKIVSRFHEKSATSSINAFKESLELTNQIEKNQPIRLQILIVDENKGYFRKVREALKNHDSLKNIYSNKGIDIQIKIVEYKINDPESGKNLKYRCLDDDKLEDLQCILIDKHLTESDKNILKNIKKWRTNIPVYLLTNDDDSIHMRWEDEYKWREEYEGIISKDKFEDIEDILNKIVNHFNDRRATPFWRAFKKYVVENSDSWHTPGHSRGASFRNSPYLDKFYKFWGDNTFAGDLSVSVGHLGDLLDSTNYINDAQKKAANTFGTTHTFFATNGSSTSNKIMLQSIIKPKDKVIVDRNCHKSIHYACIQAGADVRYLDSAFSEELGIFAPPSLKKIEEAVIGTPDAVVIVITGCTYDGLLINTKQLVEFIKDFNIKNKKNVKIFIDEAWFAYAGFHEAYIEEYSAVRNKADYITHSTHKVLSAFSQASYLHINDKDFNKDFFREIYYIYTSTSPQYQMIASLDVASMQMEMEGYKLVERARILAERFIKNVNDNLSPIRALKQKDLEDSFKNRDKDEFKGVGHDPLKITLDIRGLNLTEDEVLNFLREEAKIEIEKSTFATITILFTIGVENEKISRLYSALVKLKNKNNTSNKKKSTNIQIPPKIDLGGRIPYDYFYHHDAKNKSLQEIEKLIEKNEEIIACGLVTPYPPGIPVLVPGQKIVSDHILYINEQLQKGVKIHGCHKNDKTSKVELFVLINEKNDKQNESTIS